MILMHIFAVAIGAFNPTRIFRDLQPDPRVAPCAAIAGNTITVDNLGFRRWNAHRLAVLLAVAPTGMVACVYEPSQFGGQEGTGMGYASRHMIRFPSIW